MISGIGLLFISSFTFGQEQASDISGHMYQESIQYLYIQEVVKGYPDGTFGPNRPITRAEIIKIILEASADQALGSGSNCFPDVSDERFAHYVCYAKQHAIIKGYPDGTFKPQNNVTIAEWLKMALESFDAPVTQTDDYNRYQSYMDFVHESNIRSKYSLSANKSMTRGQMAYLTQKLMLDKQWIKKLETKRKYDSLWCGSDPLTPVPSEIIVNGLTRHFIMSVWKNYNKDEGMKLIFAFHGRTNPNTMIRSYYKIEKASKGDAIIIYPSGLPEEWPQRNRSNPWDLSDQLRDFALFDQLLKEISNTYCINMDQVFVVGHSLWARFTNTLSCTRGDVIRAIWSVGGWTTINDCSWPVAAMIMHNPNDRLASFRSGEIARDQLLEQNSCGWETKPIGPPEGNCVLYTQCQSDAPVIRCPHTVDMDHRGVYYPHNRPDFAGQLIRDFLQAQK